jgi:hypothetical protein
MLKGMYGRSYLKLLEAVLERNGIVISQQNLDHINRRWGQLYNLSTEWANRCINYLFLANSGGAIAMLGFIGARPHVHPLVVWGLALMLVGLVLVGILTAHTFHQMQGLFQAWRKDVKEYFVNRIAYEKLLEDDETRAREKIIDYVLGYSSFCCFILGIALGIRGLFL